MSGFGRSRTGPPSSGGFHFLNVVFWCVFHCTRFPGNSRLACALTRPVCPTNLKYWDLMSTLAGVGTCNAEGTLWTLATCMRPDQASLPQEPEMLGLGEHAGGCYDLPA